MLRILENNIFIENLYFESLNWELKNPGSPGSLGNSRKLQNSNNGKSMNFEK